MFPGLGEPYQGERRHFTLTRYMFLTPSSAYSSYNHHPIAPHRGQMTVPGYILDVSGPWGAVPGRKTPFYPDVLHVSDTVFRLLLIQSPSNSSTSRSNDCARIHTGYASPNIRPTTDYPRLPTQPHPTMLHTLPCIWSTFLCCHCCLKAFLVDQPLPVCNLHSIKTQETRVCKNVSSKNKGKCRDGAVCL